MKKESWLFPVIFLSLLLSGCTLQDVTKRLTPASIPLSPEPSDQPNFESTATPSAKLSQQNLKLTIDNPKDGVVVNSSNLVVNGTTEPGSEVMINEAEVRADAKGNFRANLNLDEGENIISVVANDKDGNWAELEIAVTYQLEEKKS